MEIDPEEVKRHLNILGYTSIEPNLLDKFVEDLKKLIEYDQKHGDVSVLSTSQNQSWNNSYSARIKTNTANKNYIENSQITNMDRPESNHLKKKQKYQDSTLRTSSKIMCYHNNTLNQNNLKSKHTQQKCYFCGEMESKPRIKDKHRSNPLQNIYIGATFNIE